MLERNQPGVTLSEHFTFESEIEYSSALPIFIGYTETQPEKNEQAHFITTLSEYIDLFGTQGFLSWHIRHFFENGGTQAYVYSLGKQVISAPWQKEHAQAMIAALQQEKIALLIGGNENITLIVAPEFSLLNTLGQENDILKLWLTAWQTLLTLSQAKLNLFSLLDAPDNVELAKKCLTQLESDYRPFGAVYWPRLETYYVDKDNSNLLLSPTAVTAAIMQTLDNEIGPWKAPANVELQQVLKPTQDYLAALSFFESDSFAINIIRVLPGRGLRIWGCRTLEKTPNSIWRYIQIRRLISYIEQQLMQLGRTFVFEPNNEITWIKLKGLAYDWLHELWTQGALYGSEEEKAFNIILGIDESMTQEDIKAGIMRMIIQVAVLSPAEFIEINLNFNIYDNYIE